MGPRFVAITAAAMYATLDSIGTKIEKAGGMFLSTTHGKEIVYHFFHHKADNPAFIRVYTTITKGASEVRECGDDAIRVVIGCSHGEKSFIPLGKSRKILRTAPQGVEDREAVFLTRLTDAIREAYVKIQDVQTCPKCGAPMVLRTPKKNGKKFTPFYGCVSWPSCNGSKNA